MLPEFIASQRNRQPRRLLRSDRFIEKLAYIPFWRLGQGMRTVMWFTRILLLSPTHLFVTVNNMPFLVYR